MAEPGKREIGGCETSTTLAMKQYKYESDGDPEGLLHAHPNTDQ